MKRKKIGDYGTKLNAANYNAWKLSVQCILSLIKILRKYADKYNQ